MTVKIERVDPSFPFVAFTGDNASVIADIFNKIDKLNISLAKVILDTNENQLATRIQEIQDILIDIKVQVAVKESKVGMHVAKIKQWTIDRPTIRLLNPTRSRLECAYTYCVSIETTLATLKYTYCNFNENILLLFEEISNYLYYANLKEINHGKRQTVA